MVLLSWICCDFTLLRIVVACSGERDGDRNKIGVPGERLLLVPGELDVEDGEEKTKLAGDVLRNIVGDLVTAAVSNGGVDGGGAGKEPGLDELKMKP